MTAETLTESIAARWRRIAELDGWQLAHDDITGEPVVFNEQLGAHYHGPDAWKMAALHDKPWEY